MIILPTSKGISLRNMPVITLLIVLVNVVVFSAFQADDMDSKEAAVDAYFKIRLDKVETPAFTRYLAAKPEKTDLLEFISAQRGHGLDRTVVWFIQNEPKFLDEMQRGIWLEMEDDAYSDWQKNRARFDELWSSSFSDRYFLKYNEFSVVRLVSHQFLHGSFMHLLGNMVFLIVLGTALEGAVGMRWFLLIYIGAGTISGLGSLALHWTDPSGALGASGAIAGLMGAYATVFWMRKIRFFYWVFIYFGYLTAPALLVLPVWLGWELLQWSFTDSNVAYDAHAFGIVGGGLLGWLSARFGRLDLDFMETDSKQESAEIEFQNALQSMAELRIAEARRSFRDLSAAYPKNEAYALQWFRTCAMDVGSEGLHLAARKVLLGGRWDTESHLQINAEFHRYVRATKGKIRLPRSGLAKLARRFVVCGHLEDADRIVRQLISTRQAKGQRADELDVLLFALIERYRRDGKTNSARDLSVLFRKEFPASELISKVAG